MGVRRSATLPPRSDNLPRPSLSLPLYQVDDIVHLYGELANLKKSLTHLLLNVSPVDASDPHITQTPLPDLQDAAAVNAARVQEIKRLAGMINNIESGNTTTLDERNIYEADASLKVTLDTADAQDPVFITDMAANLDATSPRVTSGDPVAVPKRDRTCATCRTRLLVYKFDGRWVAKVGETIVGMGRPLAQVVEAVEGGPARGKRVFSLCCVFDYDPGATTDRHAVGVAAMLTMSIESTMHIWCGHNYKTFAGRPASWVEETPRFAWGIRTRDIDADIILYRDAQGQHAVSVAAPSANAPNFTMPNTIAKLTDTGGARTITLNSFTDSPTPLALQVSGVQLSYYAVQLNIVKGRPAGGGGAPELVLADDVDRLGDALAREGVSSADVRTAAMAMLQRHLEV